MVTDFDFGELGPLILVSLVCLLTWIAVEFVKKLNSTFISSAIKLPFYCMLVIYFMQNLNLVMISLAISSHKWGVRQLKFEEVEKWCTGFLRRKVFGESRLRISFYGFIESMMQGNSFFCLMRSQEHGCCYGLKLPICTQLIMQNPT